MKVRVLYFAALRERAGMARSDEEVAPGTSVGALWEQVRARPGFSGAATVPVPGFSVNGDWCAPSRLLSDGDEVGFLPPVSGG